MKTLDSDIDTYVYRRFIIYNPDGTIQLEKPCIFLSSITNECSIYTRRPIGCRLYPVVWNNGITVDTACQGHEEIPHLERHSILLHKYLWDINKEAKERREQ
jgi:Fe-S-cluster containining protein